MKLRGDFPAVLLPVEIGARDLGARIVLASALAAKGCRTIVAHDIVAVSFGRGSRRLLFQGKELFSETSDRHLADRLIANESAIMLLQDEGGIFHARSWERDVVQKHYVDKVTRRNVSRVCLWGERQAGLLTSRAAELGSISTVTGSPRFDLCAPAFAWMTPGDLAADARPYILACTRFTAIAHALGPQNPFQRKFNRRVWPDDVRMDDVAEAWFARWRQDVHDFADFVLLVKRIASEFPDFRVVLRPHPSENLDFYRSAFAPVANVAVVRDGSALDWIRSAALLVHSNCTTGIEGVLAGRPVMNFLPGGPERAAFDIEVASEAGVAVGTIDEAVQKARELLADGAPEPHWSEKARSVLNNLKAPSMPLIVQQTMEVLRERGIDASSPALSAESTVKAILRPLVYGREAYARSKRGRLTASYVETILDGCRSRALGKGRISHLASGYVVIDP
jgi:surface carbohydrate biosynthesis protein